ncbi:MAG: type II toxin-antitoxin system VapC family toxin [Chitinispirillaceae bacterium]|nr:type II toxin-antitoxin system VapC family toxin [Chitinispirillaceae bacterium]
MNVVDSSGWIEYFIGSVNAEFFAPVIEDEASLIVPSITMYEVFRKLLVETDEDTALRSVTQMQLGRVVALDEPLAINAARTGYDLKIPMADSIILATARAFGAILYTMDDHFKGLSDVKFFPKKK